jgi:hypothetical protein
LVEKELLAELIVLDKSQRVSKAMVEEGLQTTRAFGGAAGTCRCCGATV